MKNNKNFLIFVLIAVSAMIFVLFITRPQDFKPEIPSVIQAPNDSQNNKDMSLLDGVEKKKDLIQVESPLPNTAISSPLTVKGKARGNWYFEATFPVDLVNEKGEYAARGYAQADGEWMTTEFVPFTATLTFATPIAEKGTLILRKDNPSGLPENDDSISIPLFFKQVSSEKKGQEQKKDIKALSGVCKPSGCSGHICSDQEIITTCEYRPEYACYKTARCERQASGECGWTENTALRQCIENLKSGETIF